MSSKITGVWHGHSTWGIEIGAARILIDPFLDDNPAARTKAAELSPTHILVSHAHADHIADAAPIALRTGAHVLANFEIAQWLGHQHRVKHTVGMNHGGAFKTEFGRVMLVPAVHSSSLPDGSYGGTAGGWLIEINRPTGQPYRIYYAGDTAVFGDMKWIARRGIDCLIVPIGDLFTMGPEDSLDAIALVAPSVVLPTHYNTWPPIAQNPHAWADAVRANTSATPQIPTVDTPFELG
ncbi:MAG: metal-dependent hydrolase [Planctomycetota bacterium]|jgi:L-ascorbate metabolism protein UlaG (beta-lactamase superfamily)